MVAAIVAQVVITNSERCRNEISMSLPDRRSKHHTIAIASTYANQHGVGFSVTSKIIPNVQNKTATAASSDHLYEKK